MGILGSASGSGGPSTPSLWNRLRTGPGRRPKRITKGNLDRNKSNRGQYLQRAKWAAAIRTRLNR